MMKVLLLGVGMQGKAALLDLYENSEVSRIVAADMDQNVVKQYINERGYQSKAIPASVDASSNESLEKLIGDGFDVIVDLLPPMFVGPVATAAVAKGIPCVNTFYAVPEVKKLDTEAKRKGVTILPEFGMDPGIDLVLLGEAIRSLDSVEEVMSYGAGFPEPSAADNAIKYKVTWTFEGVLKSYKRDGRVIKKGKVVDIAATEMFAKKNIHKLNIDGLGELEAFPNGDVIKYVDLLGLDITKLHEMGRYVLRWPGHCEFWRTMVGLGLLDDGYVNVDGVKVDRKKYLANALQMQIQYKDNERDVVLVRIEVAGRKNGKKTRSVYQIVDKRDLNTGLTAMSRTVGFSAAIGAYLLGSGKLTTPGVLSPVNDVPYKLFTSELAKRGITTTETTYEIK
jgi:saccharopine dehydrogenase-like NADP-dependent oxidoreductase